MTRMQSPSAHTFESVSRRPLGRESIKSRVDYGGWIAEWRMRTELDRLQITGRGFRYINAAAHLSES